MMYPKLYVRWKQGYGGMTQVKVDKLNAIGFEFAPLFEDMYDRLVVYNNTHGHCNVSKEHDPRLAAWVRKQKDILARHNCEKSSKNADDRVKRLLSLGLQPDQRRDAPKMNILAGQVTDTKWNKMLEELSVYKTENSHCNVSTTSGTKLANWVATQRYVFFHHYQSNTLNLNDENYGMKRARDTHNTYLCYIILAMTIKDAITSSSPMENRRLWML